MTAGFSVGALLAAMAARGSHAAIVTVQGSDTQAMNDAEVASLARALAAALVRDGLRAGEAVGLWGPNSPDWIIASLAIVQGGGVIVPIDDQAGDAEALAYLTGAAVRRAFVSTAHLGALRASSGTEVSLIRLDAAEEEGETPHWRSLLAAVSGPLEAVVEKACDPDRPLALFYTSGTTGAPKSFFLSERNIATNVDAIHAAGVVRTADRLLLPLPLHHAYPWIVGTLTSLWIGVTIVLPQGVTGPLLLAALRCADVTVLAGVPRLYALLVGGITARAASRGGIAALVFRGLAWLSRSAAQRFDLNLGRVLFAPVRRQIGPKLRLCVSGGAKLDAEIIWQLRAFGYEVLSGYGLAETASIFTANLPRAKRIGSEGKPIAADGRVRIAAADETGRGEIELKGASVFSGYRDNAAETASAFTADGWFRTGDLGHLDADGFVYVTGRAKEVIVLAGGKNVFPEDVEDAYATHPFISEIAVIERQGKLVALVRPNVDAMRQAGSLQPAEAMRVALASTAQDLPSFKRLSGFALVSEALPRTRLGKYRRFLLPDLYEKALQGGTKAAALAPEDQQWLSGSPQREIWALLSERYADKPLSLSASPQLDLGFDSFEWMSLIVEIEERTGIRLSEDDIALCDTVRALIERAAANREGSAQGSAGAPEPAAAAIAEPSPLLAMTARFLHAVNALIFRLLFRLRVEGAERLPPAGPCLLAPNHVSDLDPALVAAAVPASLRPRLTWAAETTRLFSGRLGRLFMRAMRIHPVDERRPSQALATAMEVLRQGGIEVWFPEAWRSPDGRLQRFLPGIGQLIVETRVPVVPVLLLGSFEAMPRTRRWPRFTPMRVVFGAPIAAETLLDAAGVEREDATAVAGALARATVDLARKCGADGVLPLATNDKND